MYAKKSRFPLWPLIIAALIIAGSLIGAAVGKYIKTESYTGSLQVTAKLADVTLLEHEAVRSADGSYTLSDKTATENTYTLIPGLDIPKDPFITIENKTSIEAYLFVEVVDNTPNGAIGYTVSTDWRIVNGVTGKHGGTVYVYAKGGTLTVLDDTNTSADPIYILTDNKITVSQTLNSTETDDTLTFYAAMGEVAASDSGDPKVVYESIK